MLWCDVIATWCVLQSVELSRQGPRSRGGGGGGGGGGQGGQLPPPLFWPIMFIYFLNVLIIADACWHAAPPSICSIPAVTFVLCYCQCAVFDPCIL